MAFRMELRGCSRHYILGICHDPLIHRQTIVVRLAQFAQHSDHVDLWRLRKTLLGVPGRYFEAKVLRRLGLKKIVLVQTPTKNLFCFNRRRISSRAQLTVITAFRVPGMITISKEATSPHFFRFSKDALLQA